MIGFLVLFLCKFDSQRRKISFPNFFKYRCRYKGLYINIFSFKPFSFFFYLMYWQFLSIIKYIDRTDSFFFGTYIFEKIAK